MEKHDLYTILKVNVVTLKSLSTIIFESLSNKIRNNKVCNRTSCTLVICFNNRLVRLQRSEKMRIENTADWTSVNINTFQLRNDEFIKLRVLGFKKQVQLNSVNSLIEVIKYIADVSFSICLFYCSFFFRESAPVFQEKRPQSTTCTSWKHRDRTNLCDCLNKLKIFNLK